MLMIRQKQYPSVAKKLWGSALGSPSYFAASCGGAQVAIIRQDIEQHRTTSNNIEQQQTTANNSKQQQTTANTQTADNPKHLRCPRYSSSPLTQRISAHPVKGSRQTTPVSQDWQRSLCSPSAGAPAEMAGLTPSNDSGSPVSEKSSPGTACLSPKASTCGCAKVSGSE